MSVSGSATLGGVVLGTGTLLPWGGGAALASVLQLGETGGIYSNNQTTLILSGCYNNGTNYQFSGTGGGTSTAGLLTIGGPGNAGGAIMAFYCGGVGTYTQQVTFTQVFQVGGTVATAVVTGYGTRAAALVDMTPDLGTFTGTWGGGITAPINTAGYWARTGNTVTILIPYGTASKSGAAGNITFAVGGFGVPLPVKTHLLTTPVCINGATTSVGVAQVTNNGTFTFQGLGGAAFVGTANWSIGITGDFTALSYTIGP
jgi:hypothetical protein